MKTKVTAALYNGHFKLYYEDFRMTKIQFTRHIYRKLMKIYADKNNMYRKSR